LHDITGVKSHGAQLQRAGNGRHNMVLIVIDVLSTPTVSYGKSV